MKLSLKNLDILLTDCTKNEISLFIHLAQFQDSDGVVGGIHYKKIIGAISISESGFYKCMGGLERKGLISQFYDERTEYGYKAFQITDNKFKNADDYKEGYLNLNYTVLHSKEFLKMTRSEKVIVLRILKIMNIHARKKSNADDSKANASNAAKPKTKSVAEILNEYRTKIRNNENTEGQYLEGRQEEAEKPSKAKKDDNRHIPLRFDTLMDWTGKSMRSVKQIVNRLSRVIGIEIEDVKIKVILDHNFHLPNRRETDETGQETTEAATKNRHIISYVLQKMRETASQSVVSDILSIIKKYSIDSFHTISRLLIKTIRHCGELSVGFFHMVARAAVGLPL